MTGNDYYSWSEAWRLEAIERPRNGGEGTEYFLDNTSGGKVILDKTVYDVLEFLAVAEGSTFIELDQQKMVSSSLLEILLKVFSRVGVLEIKKNKSEVKAKIESDKLEENPLISIVIVNYNGDKHLPDLLDSLKRQTYTQHEIIIVDNRSTDNSCQWVKTHYPEVRLLELKRNTGFAAGVNTGICDARGEWILVLNNDIVLDENALFHLAKKAAALSLSRDAGAKKWAAIVPKMKFFNNPAFINAMGNSLYPISWGSDNFIGYADLGQFDDFEGPMSACFGAVLLNRGALDKIGLLDCRYKFYYEDMDWSFRAHLCGYSIETAPKAVLYHKFGASMSLKSQAFKIRFIVGNRLYFTLKNLESKTIRRFLFNYLLEDIKSTLIYLKRKNFSMVGAYLHGYSRSFLSLPGLYFKRRWVQQQRKVNNVADSAILARAVPFNTTLMAQGAPILDVYSLRVNYAFLGTGNSPNSLEGDLMSWRLRPPPRDKQTPEKIYMQYSFFLAEPGYYDIHLLGLIKRKSDRTVYLDGQVIKPSIKVDKKNKRFIMDFCAGEKIYIPHGLHILELGWHSQAYVVILRKSDTSGGKGALLKNHPLDPRKTFDNQKFWEVQKPFFKRVFGRRRQSFR